VVELAGNKRLPLQKLLAKGRIHPLQGHLLIARILD